MKSKLCGPVVFSILALALGVFAQTVDADSTPAADIQSEFAVKNKTVLDYANVGDSVDLYSGTLSANQTDVVIPGNGPDIRIRRSFVGGTGSYHAENLIEEFGDWALNIPRIKGVVGVDSSLAPLWATNRCSGFDSSPLVYETGWTLEFDGNSRLLVNASLSTLPAGTTAVTKDFWQVSCLPSIQNGAGEGFVARSPNGTKVTFNFLKFERTSDWSPCVNNWVKGNDGVYRYRAMMLATQVVDRFGNSISYQYDSAGNLLSITASDGRSVAFGYTTFTDNLHAAIGAPTTYSLITSIASNGRTWLYNYQYKTITITNQGTFQLVYLAGVTRPDGTTWAFDLSAIDDAWTEAKYQYSSGGRTGTFGASGTITNPAGAVATFTTTTDVWAGLDGTQPTPSPRGKVPGNHVWYCRVPAPTNTVVVPFLFPNSQIQKLQQKQVTGPGLPTLTWSYTRTSEAGWYAGNTPGATSTVVSTTSPEGVVDKYTYSILFDWTEGNLLEHDVYPSGATTPARKTSYAYTPGTTVGSTAIWGLNSASISQQSLPTSIVVQQDGDTYTTQYLAYDGFNNPTSISRYNNFNPTHLAETRTYQNDTTNWVLGGLTQLSENSIPEVKYIYNALDQVQEVDRFGLKQFTYLYNSSGQVASKTDGRGNQTIYSNYYRGIPQLTQRPDSTSTSAVVNADGTIASRTDARGYTSSYSYDALGRLAGITYPTADTVAWASESLAWQNVTSSPGGAAAVLQTHSDGHLQTSTYYDPLLRPIFEQQKDLVTGVVRDHSFAYDSVGRITYASYPSSSTTTSNGITTNYDALGRVTKTYDSLSTISSFAFLANDTTQVTSGNGNITTTSYQAFDSPDTTNPVLIQAPAGQSTSISRDVFGNVLSATQSGSYLGATVSATRSYVYDAYYRLCKSVDPETSQTSVGYDAASNVAWKAIAGGAPNACTAQSAVPASRLTTFTYDALNRVTQQNEPAGTDSVTTAYDPDGRLQTLSTPITAWTYGYNKRGLLETQSLVANGGTFNISDQYDVQGHVNQRTYPDGLATPYAPSAWGTPSQVGSFATGISYWASGTAAGFNYGNGLAYSQSLDTRLRPYVIHASGGTAGNIVNLQYTYDNDNNVKVITDNGTGAQGRSLGYDGLDRLTTASGVWGNATYGYDPLDNLRTEAIGAQTVNTAYNAGTNRIDGVSGSITRSYNYDGQGNLSSNGVNSFMFDVANRLVQTAGVASYRYDGHGRRTMTVKPGNTEYSVYDLSGNLVHTLDTAGCVATDYIDLEHKPLAQTSAGVTTYLHTDELGSPIAATNGSGAWLWYEEYQPYGLKLNGVNEKVGFTGHVYDADTGLTDMQARLYDPLIGRFLSTDPEAFNGSSPFTFNRYAYANNNPYRYTDPTGEENAELPEIAVEAAKPMPLPPPQVIPEIKPVSIPFPRLTLFRVSALGIIADFLAGGCGDSRDSPSCKGSNTMDANRPPKDAKDPNGAKAPGKPGEAEGFEDPKTGEKWVKGPDGRGGWQDSKGNVWQPTGQGGLAHGGPHWDIQRPNGRGYVNGLPGQKAPL
jgi:RHS repeat-associated protein